MLAMYLCNRLCLLDGNYFVKTFMQDSVEEIKRENMEICFLSRNGHAGHS